MTCEKSVMIELIWVVPGQSVMTSENSASELSGMVPE